MLEDAIGRLLQGVSSNNTALIRSAWRTLLANRDAAKPLILEKLESDVWCMKPKGQSGAYLAALLALLHEINPMEFTHEIERLQAQKLHRFHRRTVTLLAKRKSDRIFGRVAHNVPVYISDQVGQPALAFKYLSKWAQTKDLAIESVTRIDIIARQPEIDYLGAYNQRSDGIVLTWDDTASGLAKWTRKFDFESTFYHEIGHHYFQHSEPGQVAEQEREANDYKARMFRNAHPMLVFIVRVIFFPVFFYKRALKSKSPR